MADNEQNTIRIPVKAGFAIVDGKPVMVSAEYADVNVDALAGYLIRGFGLVSPELFSVKHSDSSEAGE